MPNLCEIEIELLQYYSKHGQEIVEIIEQFVPDLTLGQKIDKLEAVPGAVAFFEKVSNLLMNKSYLENLIGTMHETKAEMLVYDQKTHLVESKKVKVWALVSNLELVFHYTLAYHQLRKNFLTFGRGAIADGCPVPKRHVFLVKDFEWNHSGQISINWPTQLENEIFFGSHKINQSYNNPDRQKAIADYQKIVNQVINKANSSAVIFLYNGIYTEPVFIFNRGGKAHLLLSNSGYIHDTTQQFAETLKLNVIRCPGIELRHNGNCSMSAVVAINTVAFLSRSESSVLLVLTHLSENNLDLKSHFLHAADIKVETKPSPSSMCIARMLGFVSDTLRAAGLENGLLEYFDFHNIDMENGLFSSKLQPRQVQLALDREAGTEQEEQNDSADKVSNRGDELAKETFEEQLQKLNDKINDLTTRHQLLIRKHDIKNAFYLNLAIQAANTLYISLSEESSYFEEASPTLSQYKKFKSNCIKHINEAHKVLDNHRGWSQFLTNLLLTVCTVGLALLGKGIYNYASSRPFFFVRKTDSEKVLNDIEKTINSTLASF